LCAIGIGSDELDGWKPAINARWRREKTAQTTGGAVGGVARRRQCHLPPASAVFLNRAAKYPRIPSTIKVIQSK